MDSLREHIHKLREDFSKGVLNESDVQIEPSLQFKSWMQQAVEAQVPEVQAMMLSTVGQDNQPSSRIVYLREFGDDTFCFYTNYNSKKAADLNNNPAAALTFFWPALERQIHIRGTVQKANESQSDAYFNLRPYESKIGAWASNQSQELHSRDELEKKITELKKIYRPDSIKRPPFWGGFILKANSYEFWQGRPSRLHDRISYENVAEQWKIKRISP